MPAPIPIWFGGRTERAYRRIGRLADGWFPMMPPGPALDEARAVVAASAAEAGRDAEALGMEGQVPWHGDLDRAAELAAEWARAGATHLAVNTMGAGRADVDAHLAALADAARTLQPAWSSATPQGPRR